MTLLDAGVIAALVLIAAGGYKQGFIRGLTRTAALLSIGLLAMLLTVSSQLEGTPETVIARTLAVFGGVALVVSAMTWLINRAVPRSFHQSPLNNVLGVIPAFFQSIIVLMLILGLAHRIAQEQAMQRYIAQGIVTGPLIQPFNWVERTLAGVR